MIVQMGNNNVSGLQEEEKLPAVDTQENLTREAVYEKGESHMTGEVDDTDFLDNVEELSPDDHSLGATDSHKQNQTLDEKDKADTEEVPTEDLFARTTEKENIEEVQPEDLVPQTTKKEVTEEAPSEDFIAESDHAQTKGSSKQEQEYTVFKHHNESLEVPVSSKPSSYSDKQLEETSERLDLGTSDPRHEQQLSVARDELLGSNSAFESKFISDEQHEFIVSEYRQTVDNLGAEIRAGELLELNIASHYEQKDHKTAENFPVNVFPNISDQDVEMRMNEFVRMGNVSQEEKVSATARIDEKNIEIPEIDENGDEPTKTELEYVFSNDLGDKCEMEVTSSQEISQSLSKSIILTEESKLIDMKSENGENKCDSNHTQFSELKNSECIASQSNKVTIGFDGERNGKENANDSNSSSGESYYQLEKAKVNDGVSLTGNNIDSVSKKFEVVVEAVPEVRKHLTALTLIEANQKQENSVDGSVGRISIESNEETPSSHIELRRSPSFDFNLPVVARFEESDQTPLLCHDKAASRSLSSRDNLMFQNTTAKNQYGRDELPYEAVVVEEKTIRMERSDSDKPRAPFMSLLKKEGKTNAFVELKQEEAPLREEVMLTSNKGSGKRKPRASLFSTCICCAATIP